MLDRRYQIFISSTFRDLVDARQVVLLAIQRLNHIPAGMELFPSANDAPWDVIERILDASDYYVLIVGGRYGSTDQDGVSFTEREYDIAFNKRIPVLAFLHADPRKIPAGHCDMDEQAQIKLNNFRTKVQAAHHCTYWSTADELATKVVVSLVNEIAQNPKPGWVRGDIAEDRQRLLLSIEQIRQENEELRADNENMLARVTEMSSVEHLCQGNDSVLLTFAKRVPRESGKFETEYYEVEATWHEVFMALAWEAVSGATVQTLMRSIARNFDDDYYMEEDEWKRVATQFLALELLRVRKEMRPASSVRTYLQPRMRESATATEEPTDIWCLTEKGLKIYAQASAEAKVRET